MKKHPRFVPVPTAESLARAALVYLGRYAASESSLRRVLHNRVKRAALVHPDLSRNATWQESIHNDIETIIGNHRKTGVLDDAAYARMKTGSLRRAGRSRRFIQNMLGQKGLRAALVIEALDEIDEEAGDSGSAELKAARAFARRRKLGPFRSHAADADRRRKDFAALARAGFTLDVAKKVLGGNFEEED